MQLLKVICILLTLVIVNQAKKPPSVTTTSGTLIGSRSNSARLGVEFLLFRGIPYALAPVANLRFRNPKPYPVWKPMDYDATQDGPMCPQVTKNINDSDISENCLRLNVYTRAIKSQELKPVIVYLHPGGFYGSSGQSKNFGPEHLMDHDIVLVTLNYRLGTLGFLATNDNKAPGNAGLKDQVVALRWVKEHISSFGGNPESVTLLGYGAGSFSIGLHMVSPMSKDLFHRAIMMSASPLGQFKYEEQQKRLSNRQALRLNCTNPLIEVVDCLKRIPWKDIVNTQQQMFDFNNNPVLNWMPVIEKNFGQERFLEEDPYQTILRENFTTVPLIIGITEHEFLGVAYDLLQNETVNKWLSDESNFAIYAPIFLMYERDTPRSKYISTSLRAAYSNNINLSDPMKWFGELYSDAVIGFEYHRFLDLISSKTKVYTYLFKYKGRFSHFMPQNKVHGAVHRDELLYLFRVPSVNATSSENNVMENLIRMWTEFAKKGDPNSPLTVAWPPYTSGRKEYLEIDKTLSVSYGGIFTERFRKWDELFPVSSLTSLDVK